MEPKRQRLSFVGRGVHATKSAVASIIRELHDEGFIDTSTSRQTIGKVRRGYADITTPYGKVLTTTTIHDGTDSVDFAILNPIPLLWHLVNVCGPFNDYLETILSARPTTVDRPWGIALYTDEITPGNPTAYTNSRRVWGVYWTFLDLGAAANFSEAYWFTSHAARSTGVKKLPGAISLIAVDMLDRLFGTRDGHSFTSGIVLPFRSGPKVTCAQLQVIVADGDALKKIYGHASSSGKSPCLECKNVTLNALRLGEARVSYPSASGSDVRIVSHSSRSETNVHSRSLQLVGDKFGTDICGWGLAVLCKAPMAAPCVCAHVRLGAYLRREWHISSNIGLPYALD